MGLSLTLVLIIITSLVSWQAFNNPEMKGKLLFSPALISNRGEYYRFLTSGFIHGDFVHLLVNMYVLYLFGEFVESVFIQLLYGEMIGRIIFLVFYLSAIVVSSLPSYYRHQNNYGYAALGASGATAALVFVYILFQPWNWFVFPPLPGILLAVAYIWYSSYMDKRGTDNIGHNQHLWGAVYGLAFILIAIVVSRPELLEYIVAQLLSPRGPSFL